MNIHEYQAQQLLKDFGVPVPRGMIVTTPDRVVEAAAELGFPVVLKAQVHAGGRGKAGGVRVVRSEAEAVSAARAILGLTIKGLPVRKLWVAPAAAIASEAYLSLLVDRAASELAFIGCAVGGVDIEETARSAPEKILRQPIPLPGPGNLAERYGSLPERLFGNGQTIAKVMEIMAGMERLLWARDCALVEINPLVITKDGLVVALDAKIILDDNALFRQPGNLELKDPDTESEADRLARGAGLSFVALEGDIGCMVNGAGLAMATMDTLKHFGGAPANFLDVGGSSNPGKVITALEIILQNPKVKVILTNIFGGITRCDDVANGLLAALGKFQARVPIVVRLAGTNEEEGRALLSANAERVNATLIVASTLEEGAVRAVELARQA